MNALAGFDPERYLRERGECAVLAAERRGGPKDDGELLEAAAALIGCGVMDAASAERVIDDYKDALAMASRYPLPSRSAGHPPPAAPRNSADSLAPRRVVAPDVLVESRQGLGTLHLRWITVTAGHVSLRVSATSDTACQPPGPDPPAITLEFPDQRRIEARFVGDWRMEEQSGTFEVDVDLDPRVPWLSVEGLRISLADASSPRVSVRDLDAPNPAIAYLWQRLACADTVPAPGSGLGPALAALSAAGLVADTDPQVPCLRWAAQHALAPEYRDANHATDPPAAILTPPAGTPQEWAGLAGARTRPIRGPSRDIGIGTVTPVFDGICVAIDVLCSRSYGFSLEAEIAGVPLSGVSLATLVSMPLAFWVIDDHTNAYLGHVHGQWVAWDGLTSRRLSIDFPALDPRARTLSILATTMRASAQIELVL